MRYLFFLLLIGTLIYSPNSMAALCGTGVVCNGATRHQVDLITVSDGCGNQWSFTDGDYDQAARSMGPHYANCNNSSPPRTGTWSYEGRAGVVFPIPTDRLGSAYATVDSYWDAKFEDRYGNVSYSRNTPPYMRAICTASQTVLGSDGACYCRQPYSWSEKEKSCVTVVDKVIQPSSCSGELKTPFPLYPLNGKKTLRLDLGIKIGREQLTLNYDTSRYLPLTGATSLINGSLASDDRLPRALDGLWFTQLNKRINIQRPGTGAYPWSVRVLREDGQWTTFTRSSATTYTALTPNTVETLAPEFVSGSATSKLLYTDKHGNIETYDAYDISSATVADLTRIDYLNGGYLSLKYEGGRLAGVMDESGRPLAFQYDDLSRLKSITTPEGRSVGFVYDASGMLATVVWPDGVTRQFLHENVSLPWAVTGIIDENQNRLLSFAYDEQGRAIESQYANGAMHYSVSQNVPSSVNVSETWDPASKTLTRTYAFSGAESAVLTLPNGATAAVSGTTIHGLALPTNQTQPAGSGCNASTRASTYDANGNVVSRNDFQGQRTCYAYDSRNRETVRVEGLANSTDCSTVLPAGSALPGGARKEVTIWHPDWRLPVSSTRPGSITTRVYHGQPDPFNGNSTSNCTAAPNLPNGKPRPLVCRRVEQATLSDGTLDLTVPNSIAAYTYDAAGRVLTFKDTLNGITGYSYYSDTVFSGNEPGSIDPSYENVQLLLHGNGSEGSTLIADASQIKRQVTASGNARISTSQSLFGGASLYFDGSSYLSTPNDPGYGVTKSASTVELWIYITGDSALDNCCNARHAGLVTGNMPSSGATPNAWTFLLLGSSSVTGTGLAFSETDPNGNWYYAQANYAFAKNTWYHVAAVRSAIGVRFFINGVQQANATDTIGTTLRTAYGTANPLYVGWFGYQGNERRFKGYIDDLRITSGVARYAANFTPPSMEFPDHGLILSPSDLGHTVGDLQSITNAAGHVTQFTQYDRAGRVRQMIDPKGVVTDISYTPRGWVSTVSTTAPGGTPRVTSYSYDGVGQLTGVTQPDGSTLSYSYDAAHRLIGVTDAKGNAVSYTLDNVGNRIAEEIKDPSGVLQRSISRSFDALNRLQQVTGAAQ